MPLVNSLASLLFWLVVGVQLHCTEFPLISLVSLFCGSLLELFQATGGACLAAAAVEAQQKLLLLERKGVETKQPITAE